MFDAIGIDVFAALLLLIAILNFKRFGTFLNLSKIRLRSSEWAPVGRHEVPNHVAHLLGGTESELHTLGFEFVSALAAEPPITVDPRTRMFSVLHWHPGLNTLAAVELAEPFSGQATKIHFLTAFSDGTLLLTLNREQFTQLPVPGKTVIVDAYGDNLDAQWQAHRAAMQREASHSSTVSELSELIRHHTALGVAKRIVHLQEIGWAEADTTGQFRLTTRGAWRYAGQLVNIPTVARKALARPYVHTPEPDTRAMRLAEMDTIAANIALADQPFPAWIKASLFILTLIVSAILFGVGFGLVEAVALITVIFVHELGHLLAMWAFDYRNLSVFFLPFLGAAATGHKPHATPWQETVVLLAGPVPGLLLALAALLIPSDTLPQALVEFVRSFVWFGLILNLFNLLPFGMLDGGRLFELAVLGRFPYARAAFAIIGALIGLAYAWQIQSLVLGLAMGLLLASTGLQLKAAKAIHAIRTRAKSAGKRLLGGETILAALGREFARDAYGDNGIRGWMQRQNVARLAYPRLLQGVPGLGVTIAALSAQGTALLAPLVVVVWLWQQPDSIPLMHTTAIEKLSAERIRHEDPNFVQAEAAMTRFTARYETQTDPGLKWTMLDEYEQGMEENEDYAPEHIAWIRQQRTTLLEQLPPSHPARIEQQLWAIQHGAPGATDTIQSLIAQLRSEAPHHAAQMDEERLSLLLAAYRRLTEEAPPDVLDAQSADLDRLWTTLESAEPALVAQRPYVASLRAHMAFQAGHASDAETWMDRYRNASSANDQFAEVAYAWFLLDTGQHDRVLAMAQNAVVQEDVSDFTRTRWQTLAGWAEMGKGRPREADTHFQSVLNERATRMQRALDELPWWARLLSPGPDLTHRLDPATLDHLAALELYDPQQAGQLLAELRQPETGESQRPAAFGESTVDGWGRVRQAAHTKILASLGLGSENHIQTAYPATTNPSADAK